MKVGYVAIIGQPNVGKSTLLNRFVGEELAIVTPKPQTTRHKIIGILNRPDAQVIFLDTPGFHKSGKPLNRMMLERINEAVHEADVIILMMEPKAEPDETDRSLYNKLPKGPKKIVVINKIDTIISEPWGNIVNHYWEKFDKLPTIVISATTGHGCDKLLDKIVEFLPEAEKFFPTDQYTEHPVRFLASEIIRGEAMMLLHQELPYSLAVEIDSFKEPPSPLASDACTRIRANLIVEKDSQKAIVIGKGGDMIKKIGTLSRAKIEPIVGTKVYLELYVKVEENWTKKGEKLKRFV